MGHKKTLVSQLEERSARADFWQDQKQAQGMMRQLTEWRDEITLWEELAAKVRELKGLLNLAEVEKEETIAKAILLEANDISRRLDHLEVKLLLNGEHDKRNGIVALHAGAGGTESQDWAEMLLRMYLRWAERRGYETTILDSSPGEEAGLKSVTFEVVGPYAYGYLKAERGVHRLVRLSPFDAAHRRHTSFALVEVMPEVENEVEVKIEPDDLRMETFRSSGAGGQNVQKTSTAVRLTHLPTGIVVSCQNERSQWQNREMAMKILRARLLELEEERREEEQSRLKGQHVAAGWGNQIRSYVLHPYNLVKDHRTDWETSNTNAVLDGEIDPFIEAFLKRGI